MDTKALRQKILDLAIRGKLVPQDPNDEPASVLLERIRAEKQQLVKEGKLKAKDIKNDTIIFKGEDNLHYEKFADGSVKCIEDEIPFDLPDGWAWCRLRDIFSIGSSKRVVKSEWKSKGVPFYRAREIVKMAENGFVDNDLFISEEHYTKLKKEYGIPQVGDLMVTGVGTIGKVYIVKETDRFYYKDASVLCFARRSNAITSDFAKYEFDSPLFQNQIHNKTYGNTVDTITITTAENYIFALPPISEQKRIVVAIIETLELIKTINNSRTFLQNEIQILKSKILDLAIRGKLVPQDPNDEPASVLLERIRAEKEELIKQGKIKRDKKESVIFKGEDNSYYEKVGSNTICIDDEIPFDIPDNWCWSRLENIVQILDNERIPVSLSERKKRTSGKTKDQLYPYYGATGATGYIDDFLFDGDYLLLGEDGAPFLEKQAQKAYTIKGKSWVNNHAHILKPFISIEFLCAYLNAMDYLNYVHGTTRLKLTQFDMCRIIVPIPPKYEQDIICFKVNNIIDSLCCAEASLK